VCFEGYMGGDCSLQSCPFGLAWVDYATGNDIAHNPAECSNMGACDRSSGVCECRTGWDGTACDRLRCPSQCNLRGKCLSLLYYAQTKDPGLDMDVFPGPPDEINKVYTYTTNWDTEKIYGCSCDSAFYGPDCSLQYCPSGDDPRTLGQFNEKQKGICKAGGGTFTLTFRGQTTKPIPYNADSSTLKSALEELTTITRVKITFFNDAACNAQKGEWTVEFEQEFGDVPMIVANGEDLFFSDGSISTEIAMSEMIRGDKENLECSGRGICDVTTGFCTCSTNYKTSNGENLIGTRGDCGHVYQSVSACPGLISCSGHGECSGPSEYKCGCSAGWRGADCSERECPRAVSWFDRPSANEELHIKEYTECGNMGLCDRTTGKCTCFDGFTGGACDRLSCPGSPTCSGHGECYSMYDLAKRATINGVIQDYTYGDTPNNPLTWDAEMIMGCVCNEGYHGYDCSLMSCPTGDNPDSRLQQDETQVLTCIDGDATGTVTFRYKEVLSEPVDVSAMSHTLQAALEAMPNIRRVHVFQTNATKEETHEEVMCSPSGSSVGVTFLTEHGDLPLLEVAATTGGASMTITESIKGTKENAVCSDRGICDESTGLCTCFPGYAGSDGMGGPGIINDCGHVEKIITSMDA
jgi:hypothetical protein